VSDTVSPLSEDKGYAIGGGTAALRLHATQFTSERFGLGRQDYVPVSRIDELPLPHGVLPLHVAGRKLLDFGLGKTSAFDEFQALVGLVPTGFALVDVLVSPFSDFVDVERRFLEPGTSG
jgi:hypothetical protein